MLAKHVVRRMEVRDKMAYLIQLAKAQRWEEIEHQYPGDWIRNGAKLKSLYWKQTIDAQPAHLQHLWIFGRPGTGKSSVVEVLFPGYYYKRPDEDWTGYVGQETVYIGDLDPESYRRVGSQNLKVWCDPQGFNANRKYAGGEHITIGRLVVTSNFRIYECMRADTPGYGTILESLKRRLREVHIDTLLAENGLVLRSREELDELRAQGNADYRKCFKRQDVLSELDEFLSRVPKE